MLWRLAVIVGLLWFGAKTVFAEESVLNNPPAAVGIVKAVVEKIQPSYETVWAWSDGTWSQGVSGSLYNFELNQVHLASLRLGYATGEKLYSGIGLDLPGLATRFVPQVIKGYATTAPLNTLWSVVGKYGCVTPLGGYDFEEGKALYGIAFGAALNW